MKNNGEYIKTFIICAISFLIVINLLKNEDFFKISITDLLLIGITYYLGTTIIKKRTTDERLKLQFESLLDKFESMIFDKDSIEKKILEQNRIDLLMYIRRLNNHASILFKKAKKLNVLKEVKDLCNYYNDLNDIISYDMHKIDDNVELELQRIRANIEWKCLEIKFKIL